MATTLPGRPRSPISSSSRSSSCGSSGGRSRRQNSTSRIAAGRPISARLDGRPERGVGQAQLDHHAVDQLHRRGPQLHDVLRGLHRGTEGREVDDAQHAGRAAAGPGCSVRRARDGERAFGADQQVREVDAAVARCRAARSGCGRCRGCSRRRGASPWASAPRSRALVRMRQRTHRAARCASARAVQAGHRAEVRRARRRTATRSHAEHVVHHVAVGDGARAAGVVAGHAAERGLRAGGHVDREPQAVRLELRVERGRARCRAPPSAVRAAGSTSSTRRRCLLLSIDQRRADGLAALAGAGAARQHRHLQLARDVDRRGDVALGLRHEARRPA